MPHHKHLSKHGDRHHRLPRSRGGKDDDANISRVHAKYHRAFHQLFGNMHADEIARVLTEVWIDPDVYMVCVPRKKKSPPHRRKRRYCEACECVVLQHVTKKREPCRRNKKGR